MHRSIRCLLLAVVASLEELIGRVVGEGCSSVQINIIRTWFYDMQTNLQLLESCLRSYLGVMSIQSHYGWMLLFSLCKVQTLQFECFALWEDSAYLSSKKRSFEICCLGIISNKSLYCSLNSTRHFCPLYFSKLSSPSTWDAVICLAELFLVTAKWTGVSHKLARVWI